MSEYIAHLADNDHPDNTTCGEPWQGWQAPRTLSYELTPGIVELPPHEAPSNPDLIRLCGACSKRMKEIHDS